MIENDKYYLDSVFKKCVCCGQKRTLRNYRIVGKSEVNDGMTLIDGMFSNVCKCCEKNPAMQLKSNRLANLREKMARFRANEKKRLDEIKLKEMQEECRIIGRVNYLHPDKE